MFSEHKTFLEKKMCDYPNVQELKNDIRQQYKAIYLPIYESQVSSLDKEINRRSRKALFGLSCSGESGA